MITLVATFILKRYLLRSKSSVLYLNLNLLTPSLLGDSVLPRSDYPKSKEVMLTVVTVLFLHIHVQVTYCIFNFSLYTNYSVILNFYKHNMLYLYNNVDYNNKFCYRISYFTDILKTQFPWIHFVEWQVEHHYYFERSKSGHEVLNILSSTTSYVVFVSVTSPSMASHTSTATVHLVLFLVTIYSSR